MSDSNSAKKFEKTAAKAAKKKAKAQAKQAKKSTEVVADESETPTETTVAPALDTTQPTPAERSAASAERQVKLQTLRVIIAVAALTVGLVTFLLTMTPWQSNDGSGSKPSNFKNHSD